MAYSSEYGRNGICVKVSLTKEDNTDEDMGISWEPAFTSDLNYDYSDIVSGSLNESTNQGNIWIWVTGSNSINNIKNHSSIISVIDE
tara:strand:+ start:167 stop:427 length:261 start_codon:yes stop_codon:yes gene_type:complete